MPRALWQSYGGGQFPMSEVPLYARKMNPPRSGFGVQGSGFRVQGSGFRVESLEAGV